MVCNYTIYSSVNNCFCYSFHITFFPERRIHSVIGISHLKFFIGIYEIVRTGFTSNFQTSLFCISYKSDASFCTYMSDVNLYACRSCKSYFTCCYTIFRREKRSGNQ